MYDLAVDQLIFGRRCRIWVNVTESPAWVRQTLLRRLTTTSLPCDTTASSHSEQIADDLFGFDDYGFDDYLSSHSGLIGGMDLDADDDDDDYGAILGIGKPTEKQEEKRLTRLAKHIAGLTIALRGDLGPNPKTGLDEDTKRIWLLTVKANPEKRREHFGGCHRSVDDARGARLDDEEGRVQSFGCDHHPHVDRERRAPRG